MSSLFEDKYFNAVRPYMPEEARRVLDDQVPVIRKQVSEEIDEFAKNLAGEIQQELTAFKEEQVKELNGITDRLTQLAAQVGAVTNVTSLKEQAGALQTEIKAFRDRNEQIGQGIRRAAISAARAAGLPIPPGIG